jgi:hypothetical protein
MKHILRVVPLIWVLATVMAYTQSVRVGSPNTGVYRDAHESESPPSGQAEVTCVPTRVSIKVFLEGAYAGGGSMRTSLNDAGIIPTAQPYNTSPWNYSGTEHVGSIPPGVVDWVLVQLRFGQTATVATRAAFLKSNGSIVDLDGSSALAFSGILPGNYYIVIRHRNHLAVMSAHAVVLGGLSATYDFTTGSNKYFGTTSAAKDVGSGVWGMIAGNADNSDQSCLESDLNVIKAGILEGASGYLLADIDMDGDVFPSDFAMSKLNVLAGYSSQVP